MAFLIKAKEGMGEGYIFNRWLDNRLRKNKNVLTAQTGSTGSSKSYQDLRRAELWYKMHFKKEFPAKNICFSVAEVVKLLNSKELKKGEVIIMEEAGANFGSLDFQQRVAKLFNYVLQSFRSMNVFIFFNLPYLSMLNKSARLLIHVHFVTSGINFKEKTAKSKVYFRQVNQDSGKVYNKFLRIKSNGKVRTIKRFNYNIPSEELINIYETKKAKFLSELTSDFSKELDELEKKQIRKMARADLTDKQRTIYNLACEGLTQKQIAERLGKTQPTINGAIKSIKKKGYSIIITEKSLEKGDIKTINPILAQI